MATLADAILESSETSHISQKRQKRSIRSHYTKLHSQNLRKLQALKNRLNSLEKLMKQQFLDPRLKHPEIFKEYKNKADSEHLEQLKFLKYSESLSNAKNSTDSEYSEQHSNNLGSPENSINPEKSVFFRCSNGLRDTEKHLTSSKHTADSEQQANQEDRSESEYSTSSEHSANSEHSSSSEYLKSSEHLPYQENPSLQHLTNSEYSKNFKNVPNPEYPPDRQYLLNSGYLAKLEHSTNLEHAGNFTSSTIPKCLAPNFQISGIMQNSISQNFWTPPVEKDLHDGELKILIGSVDAMPLSASDNSKEASLKSSNDSDNNAETNDISPFLLSSERGLHITKEEPENSEKLLKTTASEALPDSDDEEHPITQKNPLIVTDESYVEYFMCSRYSSDSVTDQIQPLVVNNLPHQVRRRRAQPHLHDFGNEEGNIILQT